jgi:CheY-like chemotaxis protein
MGQPVGCPGRARVLVVDDEPMLATTLRVLLGRSYDVTVASSGEHARQILDLDRDFDAVLCDLMMPGVSGIDLFHWLASAEPALARRTIFMTGGAFTDEGHDFLATVGNRRVHKPFEPEALEALLEAVVTGGR